MERYNVQMGGLIGKKLLLEHFNNNLGEKNKCCKHYFRTFATGNET